MSSASPPTVAAEPPPSLRFELWIRPGGNGRPWRAELRATDGERRDFANPLELARHLGAVGTAPARGPGGLR